MSTQLAEMISDSQQTTYDKEYLLWGDYGGELLGVRPFEVTRESLERVFKLHSNHDSFFTDMVDPSFERFAAFLIAKAHFVAEVVTLPEEQHVGFMYLTDLVHNENDPNEISHAFGHFSFWEGKLGKRRDLISDSMKLVARSYGIHRLAVRIPVYAKGAIRAASKLGFTGDFDFALRDKKNIKVEAVLRKAIKFKGEWHDMVIMSLVGEELWDSHQRQVDQESQDKKL